MSRVIAVVEGQTEQDFVREILAPWLATKGIFTTARLVGKPGHKGGVGPYQRARLDILVILKSDPEAYVTTMFDFFGMPNSWPGRSEAEKLAHQNKAPSIECCLLGDISKAMGPSFNEKRFLPYIQLHEFESLLFSHPPIVGDVLLSPAKVAEIQKIRDAFASPEEINDCPATAPSKRLIRLFPNY